MLVMEVQVLLFGVYKLKGLEQANHLIFKIGDVITLVEENISKYKIQMKDFHLQLFLKLQQKNLIMQEDFLQCHRLEQQIQSDLLSMIVEI